MEPKGELAQKRILPSHFAPRTAYYLSFRGSGGRIPGAHAIAILVVASFFLFFCWINRISVAVLI